MHSALVGFLIMANENKVIEKILTDAGYWLHRDSGKHAVYTNGKHKIAMPTGKVTSHRFRHWIRSQIRQRERADQLELQKELVEVE
jgi:hypothetical protein